MNKKDFTFKGLIGRRCLYIGFLTVCFVMFSGLVFASHAQNVRLSLKLNNETMSSAIQKIAKQSNLDFFYSQQQLSKVDKKVSVDYTDTELSAILTEVLAGTNFTFKFEENGVIIIPRPVTTTAIQQQTKRELKGKVVEAGTKKPLAGATIIVAGTANGAISDAEGNFVLSLLPANKQIEVSYTGYITEIVEVTTVTTITVEMKIAAAKIEDVVVTGVFTRKQNTYSGSVSTIKAEELKRTGNINILQALGNIDPSFMIVQNNDMGSNPNATPEIQMRGSSAFADMKDNYSTNPNQPLFIMDGFEVAISKVMDMDMNRVASVTLLKDATAKAIYGSKGANGVVVIETIKPEKGKLRFSYKGDLNIQMPDLSSYNMADGFEKLEIELRSGKWGAPYQSPVDFARKRAQYNELYKQVVAGANTDWMNIPVQTGVGQKHSVTIEGGDDVLDYSVNIAYNNVRGAMKGSVRNTLDGGFKLSYRYKGLLFREQLDITSTKGTESPYGEFSDFVKMNPYWRAYKEDGSINRVIGSYNIANGQGSHDIYNPLINAQSNYRNTDDYVNITNNFYIEWQATKDLKLIGRLGVSNQKDENHLFYPSTYTTVNPNKKYSDVSLNFISITPDKGEDYYNRGLYELSNGNQFKITAEASANYSKQLGKHLIFANAQYSISNNKTTTNTYQARGFADNATSINQAHTYNESSAPFGYDNSVRDISVIASLNYSFDSRYMFDANYRAGASSLFGANNRWGHFWSIGAGWNLHEEKFMESAVWLNQLKIRASTGYTGSQNFSSFQAIAMYEYFPDEVYDNTVGAHLLGLANPDLQWQLTRDNNIGVDISLINKLDIKFDYYVNNTENMLTPISVVTSTGFTTYQENLGESQNKGFEANVRYRVIADAKRDFFLSINATIASNTNKIMKINDALQTMNKLKDDESGKSNSNHEDNKEGVIKPKVRYEEGQSLSAIWAVRSLGINPANGYELFLDKNGNRVTNWSADDQVVVGDALEKYRGNFGFNGDYKGFTFNVNFAYRFGGQTYNTTLVDKVENLDIQYNVDKRAYTDSWTTVGQHAKYKKITDPNRFTQATSRFVYDLNELRLANLSIGYDFRNFDFVKNGKTFSAFRLSLNMNDVFTISTVKQERGILYPYARSFVFSVSATF